MQSAIIIDFGRAIKFSESWEKNQVEIGGGNTSHFAPEILNGKALYKVNPSLNMIKCDKVNFYYICSLYNLPYKQFPAILF